MIDAPNILEHQSKFPSARQIYEWVNKDLQFDNKERMISRYTIVDGVHYIQFVLRNRDIPLDNFPIQYMNASDKLIKVLPETTMSWEYTKTQLFELGNIFVECLNKNLLSYNQLPNDFCLSFHNSRFTLSIGIYFDRNIFKYRQTSYLCIPPVIKHSTITEDMLCRMFRMMEDIQSDIFTRYHALDIQSETARNQFYSIIEKQQNLNLWNHGNFNLWNGIIFKLNYNIRHFNELYQLIKTDLKQWRDCSDNKSLMIKELLKYMEDDSDIINQITTLTFSGYETSKIVKERYLLFRIKPSLDDSYKLRFVTLVKAILKVCEPYITQGD